MSKEKILSELLDVKIDLYEFGVFDQQLSQKDFEENIEEGWKYDKAIPQPDGTVLCFTGAIEPEIKPQGKEGDPVVKIALYPGHFVPILPK